MASASLSRRLVRRDWSSLPPELLNVISKKLPGVSDYTRCRSVCSPWRSAAPLTRLPPLLMFPFDTTIDTDTLRFYCPSEGKAYSIRLPEADGKAFCGSCYGWLVMMDDYTSVSLLNPFTRAQIRLPALGQKLSGLTGFPASRVHGRCNFHSGNGQWISAIGPGLIRYTFIYHTILSSDPSSGGDFIVMAILPNWNRLAFCRPGDEGWTLLDTKLKGKVTTVVHCNGRFYAGSRFGEVAVCEVEPQVTATLIPTLKVPKNSRGFRLLESNGDLFLVVPVRKILPVGNFFPFRKILPVGNFFPFRKIRTAGDDVETFKIYKLVSKGQPIWSKVESIGDNTVFFSLHYSSLITASEHSGFKRNCIYLSEATQLPHNICHKMQVVDITNGSSELVSCHRSVQPTIYVAWFTPNLR